MFGANFRRSLRNAKRIFVDIAPLILCFTLHHMWLSLIILDVTIPQTREASEDKSA